MLVGTAVGIGEGAVGIIVGLNDGLKKGLRVGLIVGFKNLRSNHVGIAVGHDVGWPGV